MKHSRLIAVCTVFVVAMLLVIWMVLLLRGPSPGRSHEIAAALLEYHQQWATHNYHAAETVLPRTLEDSFLRGSSAGLYGVYVEYEYSKFGIEWTRRFHLLRTDPNGKVWTLYEYHTLNRPHIPWLAWKQTLLVLTNAP